MGGDLRHACSNVKKRVRVKQSKKILSTISLQIEAYIIMGTQRR